MSLVRTWAGALVRASGAALIAPAAVIGALAVLALAGGFGRIGSIGQVFSGPAAPAAAHPLSLPSAGSVARASGAAVQLSGRLAAAPLRLGHGLGAGPTAPRGGGGPASTTTLGVSGRGTPTGGGSGPAPSGSAPSGPATPPSPSPSGGLVQLVVGAGTSVTNAVPGPVGATATQTLQAVGSKLGGILPVRQRITGR